MRHWMRPQMSAAIEEMDWYYLEPAKDRPTFSNDEISAHREFWEAAEDFSNGFSTRDELLERHEDR